MSYRVWREVVVIGIPLGMIVGNGIEWYVHKHWLHGRGRKKGTFWAFHWHEHHGHCRRFDHYDPDYEGVLALKWNGQAKEAAALFGACLALLPLFPILPFFVATLWAWAMNYYRVHKRAHLDTAWARAHIPWHYDHHMGPNQDANWGVTYPWWDWVLGTRVKYLGTERELADRARREARAAGGATPRAAEPVAEV